MTLSILVREYQYDHCVQDLGRLEKTQSCPTVHRHVDPVEIHKNEGFPTFY